MENENKIQCYAISHAKYNTQFSEYRIILLLLSQTPTKKIISQAITKGI